MNEICKKNVYKNITYYKNSTDGKLSLETTVLDSLCPNDCSDRGNCSNSTCTCFEDYTSADCSISLKDSPILYGIRKSGICDVRRRPCRNVGIYAFPLLDSENLTCHVQEFKVGYSTSFMIKSPPPPPHTHTHTIFVVLQRYRFRMWKFPVFMLDEITILFF